MKPNIVLIVCDTLRKDILEIYGGPAKTPNLKKFAKDAMVYENCIAPSPWTFPSHVSLFTGLYPSQHGVHETKHCKTECCIKLNRELTAERLPDFIKKQGYNTLAVSNNIMISRFAGFDSGFDHFLNINTNPWSEDPELEKLALLGTSIFQVAGELIKHRKFKDVLKYTAKLVAIKQKAKMTDFPLDKGAKLTNELLANSKLAENFFLFINYFDVHEPYEGEDRKKRWEHDAGIKQIPKVQIEHLKLQYKKEVEYLDQKLGNLIQMLKNRDLYDNSVIIITSDHGQAFNEHGTLYHGIFLWDEIIRVPLLIKYPFNVKYARIKGYQSIAHVFNLIKDVLNGRDDSRLTTKTVFAEAFGDEHIRKSLPIHYRYKLPFVIEKYEKLRKAVYRDASKLSVNGTDAEIEEFLENGYSMPFPKNTNSAKQLLSELRKFTRDSSFKIPKV